MGVPDGLGGRGSALWASLGHDEDTPAGVLALEACRAADRLDELDRIIHGKGVVELMRFRVPSALESAGSLVVEVKFDQVLAEARQQQNGLRQMLGTLAGMAPDAAVAPLAVVSEVRSPLDELGKRRAGRGAGASGARGAKVGRD